MASLIYSNIKQLTIMIACVHIMDVIIFQKIIAGISPSKTFVYVMPTFSDRGVGVMEASVLVVYNAFTSQLSIFCMMHTLLQSQNHTRVSKGRPFLCYVHKQDMDSVFWVF